MLPNWLKNGFIALFQPAVAVFARLSIKPNWLTTAGFVFGVASGFVFAGGRFFWGGLAALLSAICDSIDGSLARRSGTVTVFGRFYDSFLDRYSELAMFIGLSFYYAHNPGSDGRPMVLQEVLTNLALVGSLMVSYARARAEGLGLDCKVGLMERPERLTAVIAGSLLASFFNARWIFTGALWLLAVLTNITAVQRMLHVRARTKGMQPAGG